MRLLGLLSASVLLAPSIGCVVAPHDAGPAGGSVNGEVVDYLRREWPLKGPPTIPADAVHGPCSCSSCGGGACDTSPRVWENDWDQPGGVQASTPHTYLPPAVPLEPGPPGRFFPAPTRPVFQPSGGATFSGASMTGPTEGGHPTIEAYPVSDPPSARTIREMGEQGV